MEKMHRQMHWPAKKLLSCLLCLALVLSLVPAFGLTAAAAGPTTLYATSFETADALDEWFAEDMDGDGRCWMPLYNSEVAPDGNCCMVSYSYDNDFEIALMPDNWLLSPEITIPETGKTKISYTVFSVDPDWPEEIYHVYVVEGSTTTHIWSEDLKDGEDIYHPAERTLDLSAYAGQTVQIAFRHYGSSDIFAIGLDQVEIYNEPPALTSLMQAAVVVTAPYAGLSVAQDAHVAAGTSGYTVASAQWETTDTTFQVGTSYSLVVTLETTGERTFDDNITTYVNGHRATIISKGPDTVKFYYTFPPVGDPILSCPKDGTCPCAMFTDVDANQWCHNGIHYCVERLLMNGVGDARFDPDGTCARAMLVTVLWRQSGSPKMGSNSFSDVPTGEWYTEAVNWAAANGIVQGSGGKFRPLDNITRQEFAIVMMNYARYLGFDTTKRANLTSFADDEQVASWAKPQMEWAVYYKLFSGTDGNRLDPEGTATRAQMATILYRFSLLLD